VLGVVVFPLIRTFIRFETIRPPSSIRKVEGKYWDMKNFFVCTIYPCNSNEWIIGKMEETFLWLSIQR
jgi:hypothetical protein